MKKKRLILVLVLAIGSGTLAAYLALDFLRQQTVVPLVAAEPRRSQVAVAARDLPLGSVLRTEDIRLVSWPADALPLGYATSTAELVGRGLITPVRANEPLLSSKLADRESGGGMPILIPEGMRALSVRVDEVVGVAGFVLPGTRVDVLVTVDDRNGGNRENTISRVVLQNIAVLASGQTVQRDVEGKPQTVSVVTAHGQPRRRGGAHAGGERGQDPARAAQHARPRRGPHPRRARAQPGEPRRAAGQHPRTHRAGARAQRAGPPGDGGRDVPRRAAHHSNLLISWNRGTA